MINETKCFIPLNVAATNYSRSEIFFDLEMEKIAAPADWPFKMRWSTLFASFAYFMDAKTMVVIIVEGTESEIIKYCKDIFADFDKAIYDSFNKFDEMVLNGRFTHARAGKRMILDKPGDWPNLNDEKINFYSNRADKKDLPVLARGKDCESKLVPKLYRADEKYIAKLHNIRDLMETVCRVTGLTNDRTIKRIMTENMPLNGGIIGERK